MDARLTDLAGQLPDLDRVRDDDVPPDAPAQFRDVNAKFATGQLDWLTVWRGDTEDEGARAILEQAARTAAASIAALESPLRISVRATSAGAVRALLGRYGATYTLRRTGSKATFLIANPGGLTGDDHPFAAALAGDLAAAAIPVLAFKGP